jgi:peptide/nickel transport system substrate-binding protein
VTWRVRRYVFVGVLILFIIVVGSITYYYVSTPPTTRQRVVVYAYNDRITGIDPSIEDDTGLVIIGLVYEQLLRYNPLTNKLEPVLAVAWNSSEDGTEWVFRLREGVVFHDGTPLNATAVKLSIERARDVYRETGRGAGYIWEAVTDVEVVDEYTIKIKLEYPQRLDLLVAATYAAYIFSPKALSSSGASSYLDKKLESWFSSGNEAGSGPYTIEYYRPDSEVRLKKFDKWWGWSLVNNTRAPDYVIVKILPDPQSQYNGLISGEIDIASSVPRDYVSLLLSKGFKVHNLTSYHNYLLFFNVRRYPTNITEFRKAIACSLNLEEAVKLAMKGFGLRGSGIVPHGFPGFTEGLYYECGLSEAMQYLNESGVQLPVRIELLYQVDYEETRIFAEMLQSRLKDLNIDLVLNPQPWSQLKEIAKGVWENPDESPHLVIADWWPTIPSPYDYLYTMFHSDSKEWNFAGYEDEEFEELIDRAWELEGTNYSEALNLYREAQVKLFNEAVGINLWDEVRPFIHNARVELPDECMNPLYMYVIYFQYVRVGT